MTEPTDSNTNKSREKPLPEARKGIARHANELLLMLEEMHGPKLSEQTRRGMQEVMLTAELNQRQQFATHESVRALQRAVTQAGRVQAEVRHGRTMGWTHGNFLEELRALLLREQEELKQASR